MTGRSWRLSHDRGTSRIELRSGWAANPASWWELAGSPPRLFVLTDATVGSLWGESWIAALRAAGCEAELVILPSGEAEKSLTTVAIAIDHVLARGMRRDDQILALGGGVLGDEAGLVAGLALRGVTYHQVPTTLLAMVDAAIGGKVGVDHASGKNRIGLFYQPESIAIDPKFLATLDDRQRRSGWYEIVKSAWLTGPQGLEAIATGALAPAMAMAIDLKVRVVESDPREAGRRRILNLGHTIGHAVEAATGYRRFLHGEAVGWGLLAAARISHALHHLTATDLGRLERTLPEDRPSIADLPFASLEPFLAGDKKQGATGLAWVLLEAPGRPLVTTSVPRDVVAATWEAMRAETSGRSPVP